MKLYKMLKKFKIAISEYFYSLHDHGQLKMSAETVAKSQVQIGQIHLYDLLKAGSISLISALRFICKYDIH